ncbi:tetratricopeptide repeat protein [Poriferisphaera corsica]|uniref:tetratricopeptide repeat protein n=1 Tax=Poriferisphaera corsica TaxID=2528020 RepID=UPI0011A3E770|nr:hypothetical protein [Poriferisphaera corsica]
MYLRLFSRKRIATLSVALFACLCLTSLNAQTASPPAQTQKQMLASQYAQLASFVLFGQDDVRQDQIIRARILLDLATQLNPDSPNLWLLRAELANLENNPDASIKALRNYLRLVPQDDAAQYDLIIKIVNKEQTIDGRSAKIENILKSKSANQFSKPLRSRLAVYAASSANEMGQRRQALFWLREASSLDESNPDAALLTYQLISDLGATTQQLGSALISLVRTMPYNPQPRLQLAELLMAQGVFTRAAEQYRAAAAMSSETLNPQQVKLWAIATASTGRSDNAIEIIDQYQQFINAQFKIEKQREALMSGGNPGDVGLEQFPSIPLPLELQIAQLAIFSTMDPIDSGDRPQETFDLIKSELLAKAGQGDELAKLDYLWLGAMFKFDVDQVATTLKEFPVDNELAQIARGFIAYDKNDFDSARTSFEAYKETNPYASLGSALVAANPTARTAALQDVVYSGNAITVLLAVHQLQSANAQFKATAVGDAIRRQMDRYTNRLWNADPINDPWVQLFVETAEPQINYLDPINVKLRLKSKAPIDLAMDTPYTVSGKSMLTAQAYVLGQPVPLSPPTIINLKRKLQLAQNDEIDVTYNLTETMFGLFTQNNPQSPIIYNLNAITDPIPSFNGTLVPGIIGLNDSLNSQQILGNNPSKPIIESRTQAATDPNSANYFTSLAYLGTITQVLPSDDPDLNKQQTEDQIAQIINDTYSQADELTKAWLLRFTPVKLLNLENYQFQRVIDNAQRSDSIMVRIMYLATHITDKSDPGFIAALRSENPTIQTYAKAMSDTFQYIDDVRAKAAEEQKKQQQQPKKIDW